MAERATQRTSLHKYHVTNAGAVHHAHGFYGMNISFRLHGISFQAVDSPAPERVSANEYCHPRYIYNDE